MFTFSSCFIIFTENIFCFMLQHLVSLVFPGVAILANSVRLLNVAPNIVNVLEQWHPDEAILIALSIDGVSNKMAFALNRVKRIHPNVGLRLVGSVCLPKREYVVHRSWIKLVFRRERLSSVHNFLHFFNFSIFTDSLRCPKGASFQFFPDQPILPMDWHGSAERMFVEDVASDSGILELVFFRAAKKVLAFDNAAPEVLPVFELVDDMPNPSVLDDPPTVSVLNPISHHRYFSRLPHFPSFRFILPDSTMFFGSRPVPRRVPIIERMNAMGLFPFEYSAWIDSYLDWEYVTVYCAVHEFAFRRYQQIGEGVPLTFDSGSFIRSVTRNIFVNNNRAMPHIVHDVRDEMLTGLLEGLAM